LPIIQVQHLANEQEVYAEHRPTTETCRGLLQCTTHILNTVKPQFIVFVGGLKKK
jgi:hypothetical protein